MQVRLTEGEQARLRYATTTNLEAWSLWIECLNAYRGPVTGEQQIRARRCWEKALALDSGSATLNAMLGFPYFADASFAGADRATALRKAAYVERALDRPPTPDAHRAVSGLLLLESSSTRGLRRPQV